MRIHKVNSMLKNSKNRNFYFLLKALPTYIIVVGKNYNLIFLLVLKS